MKPSKLFIYLSSPRNPYDMVAMYYLGRLSPHLLYQEQGSMDRDENSNLLSDHLTIEPWLGRETHLNQVVNSTFIGMIFLACHIAVSAPQYVQS